MKKFKSIFPGRHSQLSALIFFPFLIASFILGLLENNWISLLTLLGLYPSIFLLIRKIEGYSQFGLKSYKTINNALSTFTVKNKSFDTTLQQIQTTIAKQEARQIQPQQIRSEIQHAFESSSPTQHLHRESEADSGSNNSNSTRSESANLESVLDFLLETLSRTDTHAQDWLSSPQQASINIFQRQIESEEFNYLGSSTKALNHEFNNTYSTVTNWVSSLEKRAATELLIVESALFPELSSVLDNSMGFINLAIAVPHRTDLTEFQAPTGFVEVYPTSISVGVTYFYPAYLFEGEHGDF